MRLEPPLIVLAAVGALAAAAGLTRRFSRGRQLSLAVPASLQAIPAGIGRWRGAASDAWQEARADDKKMMQVFIGLACIGITASVSYLSMPHLWVSGWQLWTWLVCVVIVVAGLLSWGSRPAMHVPYARYLLVLMALAAVLRVLALESVPGLLHVDELGSADFPMRHIFPGNGTTINPFVTGNASQPVMYLYLMRLSIAVFGYSISGIRITSAIAGTMAVLATYSTVAIFQDRRTALMSAAIMAAYHYHIHWSRIALNNVWDTLWVPMMLACFAWGWRKDWSGGAVLAGAAAGLSQYFYSGSKIGLILLVYVAARLYQEERDRRRLIVHGGKFLVSAAAIAAPIAIFAMTNPETYFMRTREVLGWQEVAVVSAVGEVNLWRYFWHQVWHNFGAFTSIPEITGFYGPGVPFVIGLAAPLFVVGFFWSVWRRRFLPVLWIISTILFGGFMLGGSPSSSHYVVSIPAVCWLVAVPLNWLWERGRWRYACLALIVIVATDLIFYLGVYVPSPPRDLIFPIPPLP